MFNESQTNSCVARPLMATAGADSACIYMKARTGAFQHHHKSNVALMWKPWSSLMSRPGRSTICEHMLKRPGSECPQMPRLVHLISQRKGSQQKQAQPGSCHDAVDALSTAMQWASGTAGLAVSPDGEECTINYYAAGVELNVHTRTLSDYTHNHSSITQLILIRHQHLASTAETPSGWRGQPSHTCLTCRAWTLLNRWEAL